jgi:hypothetical protein
MKQIYITFPQKFHFTAINLFGWFFINKRCQSFLEKNPAASHRMINHERIHTMQGQELLWIFFYLFYVIEWLFRLVQYRNAKTSEGKKDRNAAYRNISFEREAYANEQDQLYREYRAWFASFRYIRLK